MSAGAGVVDAARAEVAKLLRQRGLLASTAGLFLAWKVVAWSSIRAGTGADALDDFTVNGFHLMARSSHYGLALWLLLLFIHAAGAIAGEGERGQLRLFLVRPVSRAAVYLGKLWALVVLIAVALVLDAALGVVIGLPLGFGDIADPGLQGDQYAASALAVDVLRSYLLTGFALVATGSVALCVSALCSQAGTAAAIALLALVTAVVVGFLFGAPIDRYLVTTWTMEWFSILDRLTLGTSVYRDPAAWVGGVVVSTATLVVSTVVGAAAFARREITG